MIDAYNAGMDSAGQFYTATEIGVATLTPNDDEATGVLGIMGTPIEPPNAFVDSVAWAVDPSFTEILNYSNGVVLDYAPTDEVGELLISDFGNAHGIVVVIAALSTEAGGFIYKLDV
jgi:hypothetical protein